MPTTTIFSSQINARIYSFDTVYSTARSGNNFATGADAVVYPGQTLLAPNYFCEQTFLQFDTSPLPDNSTVLYATLAVFEIAHDDLSTNFVMEARTHNWGATLETTDFVPGASLSGKTLLGTLPSATLNYSAYNNFVENGDNFKSAVNLTGVTYIVLASDRQTAGNTPTNGERFGIYAPNQADNSVIPRLTIITEGTEFEDRIAENPIIMTL